MIRSLMRLLDINPGFNPRDVVMFYTRPSPEHLSSADRVRASFLAIEERMAAVSGVVSASVEMGALPFSSGVTELGFWRSDKARPANPVEAPVGLFYAVGTDYFATMAVPLRQGRVFTPQDTTRSRPVMVVDEELARTAFQSE